ncbi:MAG TPA: aminotransferase class I/II-fold pyridoxal phosphate-dependent enzyme [Haliscomenobacter sp.]|uniref:pyridoxal phosphate-dependent aminotransferase n=1 Tax=Haliscomenobacter sp. TaxID=2717303 RepID=UPI002BEDA9C7|nr:aminotransferase class I/II-fold pyridoxal phosphate-dependent enzyme [Haliscomenobacter sp.]HOY20497.1 aminotransferase class I/II-fold pyridoxal phosphate-dependent enzyme [Haliscomenobacter sp.]HPH18322.1 aminotransferase class I/II-fold pyridoxal phosphate-dependent enzyme [Haliscomenobacter sp.]
MTPIISTASRLGNVEEYYFSTKLKQIARLRAEGKNVLNLGIGSPDLPPSEATIDALLESARRTDTHAYQSYQGIPELRRAFADWYWQYFGVRLNPEHEILPLIGSKEGIMHISMSYLEAGDEVLVPNPGYPTYRSVSLLTGASVRDYDLIEARQWQPDLDALAAQDLSKVKIMWVNYPNMPTGAQADKGFFKDLIAFAKQQQILIVNDNPYTFILNENPMSLLDVPGAMDVALELNSLSKAHNMAGWRVGMLAGAAEYLEPVVRFKSNMDSGMFKPIQVAAVKALQNPPSWYEGLNDIYRARRKEVFKLLDLLECSYDPAQVGMFVWAKIPSYYADGYTLSDAILDATQVFITPGGIFGTQGNGYIRVSLCSEAKVFQEATARITSYKALQPFNKPSTPRPSEPSNV